MIQKINCTNPKIVVNPSLLTMLQVNRMYVLGDGVIRHCSDTFLTNCKYNGLSMFNPNYLGVSMDNINDFGVVDKRTGELLPLYMLVPCGKCVCCRYKKSLEWQTRCCCESASSTCAPLFFTLTYDNVHLPDDGLSKEDIQLFLKRLRTRLKDLGYDSSHLRYFIVGEYGHNTHRAHYHGLFWNFPYMNTMCDKIDIIHDTWKNGFTMVSNARDMSGSYCMKYMQKEPNHLEGKNKEFFLSSRGHGGLGIKWLRDNFEFYRTHPELNSIKVKQLDGSVKDLPMPQYFKRKLYPSLSCLIPLKVRQALDEYLTYRYLTYLVMDYARKAHYKFRIWNLDHDIIDEYFSHFGLTNENADLNVVFGYFSFIRTDCESNIHDENFIMSRLHYYKFLCEQNYDILKEFIDSHPIEDIDKILDLGKIHKDFVDRCCELSNILDLDDYIFKITNNIEKNLQREIF